MNIIRVHTARALDEPVSVAFDEALTPSNDGRNIYCWT